MKISSRSFTIIIQSNDECARRGTDWIEDSQTREKIDYMDIRCETPRTIVRMIITGLELIAVPSALLSYLRVLNERLIAYILIKNGMLAELGKQVTNKLKSNRITTTIE